MTMTLLEFFDDVYLQDRTLKPGTLRYYRVIIRHFSKYLGHPATLDDLAPAICNGWIDDLEARGCAEPTRFTNRAGLMALWNAFYQYALENNLTRGHGIGVIKPKMKKVEVAWMPRETWTAKDVKKLIAACPQLRGPFRWTFPKVERSVYMAAIISVAWDCGLRLTDCTNVHIEQIRKRSFVMLQHKTRRPVPCEISEKTQKRVLLLSYRGPRPLAFPVSYESFRRNFTKLCGLARVGDGNYRKMRRSSGMAVEEKKPGTGHLHLGNTRRVFDDRYMDLARMQRLIPKPDEV